MARQTINLGSSGWRFGRVSPKPFAAPNVYDLPAVAEWLPATVPGNVRTDLLALGRIPDPFFGRGYKESRWVEDADWWYRRPIRVDTLAAGARAFVVFEGIDYLSAIFVGGQEMARHEGMFSRQIVEITPALRAGNGQTELAVRLWGSSALPRRQLNRLQQAWQKLASALHKSWVGVYPYRSATLKCQMSFGWDFAPPIRTMGIWDDVHLIITGSVAIVQAGATSWANLSARAETQAGKESAPTPLPADFRLNLTLDALRPGRAQATVEITPANFEGAAAGPFRFPLKLSAGPSRHPLQFHLPEAALWQPWDRGFRHLYRLQITLTTPEGSPLDHVDIQTGVRTVALNHWQFTLNGQREFIRGLNWVPADSFPGRVRPAQYRRLLSLAKQSGANFLRVWGGGLREKRAFYTLCDELGLLVWQEFPFACVFLGAYPRHASYLSLVRAECSAIVRQLGHHPSVVAWCGGNEFSPRRNRPLLDTLADVVHRHDGTRPFIPVSPSAQHGRDAHNWLVWHGDAPIRAYQSETANFLSEFGLQALPHAGTLAAALPTPADPQSWPTHHADLSKLARYASLFNEQLPITNFQQFAIHNSKFAIHNSQLAQAVALQTAIEHMRRRKGEAGGVCLWQFNEPWPAISWAIVDYFGRPKLAFRRLSTWYNPVLVSLKFPVGRRWQPGNLFRAQIWAINDTLHPLANTHLLISLDSSLIHTQILDIPADSAQSVGTVAHRLTTPPRTLSLTLTQGTEVVCQNSYPLNWVDASRGSFSQRFRRWIAEWVLR